MSKYKPTIGLEIHVQLKTKTKMFCDCLNDPDEEEPNKNVCPVCMAHPGTLPVANKKAIEKCLEVGAALNCKLASYSRFVRKNYFYPDLPKGYQISQYKYPFCKKGELEINGKKIRITRVHLEEDTGKLVHPEGKNYSLVDFNRAGVPLMELVTEPDIESGKEAYQFAKKLQLILRYLGASEANMEKGQMRCEVNISLRLRHVKNTKRDTKQHKKELGTKVELKNLNSFRAVRDGIDYEIKRQKQLLDKGKEITQETRGWVADKQKTKPQRTKEQAHDYRYFPEPDLPPFEFKKSKLEKIKASVPELPGARQERFKTEYGLPDEQIDILVEKKDLGEYYEQVVSELAEWLKEEEGKEEIKPETLKPLVKLAANYIITELQALLAKASISIEQALITPENFAELIKMLHKNQVSSSAAQKVIAEMFKKGGDPSHIVEEKGLRQVSDTEKLEEIIEKVIKENPQPVKDYQSGNKNAIQALVGLVMKETHGQANPRVTKELLEEKLEA